MEEIPREILGDVFVKLSMKDIVICRQVCKTWLSITSDPHFVNYHLNTVNQIITHKHRILVNHNLVPTIAPIFSVQIHGHHSKNRKDVKLPFCKETSIPEFFGSCNGLLLVGTAYNDLFLWNPCIGSYKQIPCRWFHFKQDYPSTNTYYFRLYGFGYDSVMEAYKIIRIVRMTRKSTNYDSTRVRVYNCRTDSWKDIADFPYNPTVNGQGTIVNGAPHWIVTLKDNKRKYAIIYFELAEDVFKEVKTCLPTWLANAGTDFRFGGLEGWLCLVDKRVDDGEMWVMKESGMCWIKVVKVGWTNLYRLTMNLVLYNKNMFRSTV